MAEGSSLEFYLESLLVVVLWCARTAGSGMLFSASGSTSAYGRTGFHRVVHPVQSSDLGAPTTILESDERLILFTACAFELRSENDSKGSNRSPPLPSSRGMERHGNAARSERARSGERFVRADPP